MLLLCTLAIGFFMAMIDLTAVNVALPDIAHSLGVPLTGLVWVVDGYTLTFAALLLAGGALADRLGPKTAYQAGLAFFIVASALCGMAPNGSLLVAARMLQGMGAALFMPSSLALMSHAFPDDRQRAKMLGIWSAMVGVASAVGPAVGGLLITGFGWRGVFWVNVPIGLAGIALARWQVAATAPHRRELSVASHVLGIATLAGLTYFLIEGPSRGWLSASVAGAVLLAVAAFAWLVRRERAGAHPLLPPALLQARGFGAVNAVGFCINFGAFGQFFLLGLYLQQAQAMAALQAGMLLLPVMATFVVGNLASGAIMARAGTRWPLLIGLGSAVVLGLAMTQVRAATPYALVLLGAALMNLMVGVAVPAMTTTVMQIAGRTNANSAAAALNANRQIGALVGVAVMGSILHATPGWDTRLWVAFTTITALYAVAWATVQRRIGRPA